MDSRCVQVLAPGTNYRWKCRCCSEDYTGGLKKFVNHVKGISNDKSARIAACLDAIPEEIKTFANEKHDESENKKRVRAEHAAQERSVRHAQETASREGAAAAAAARGNPAPPEDALTPQGGGRQADLEESFEKDRVKELDLAFGRMMFEIGLPFNFAAQPALREFVNKLVHYGCKTGRTVYVPPGKDRLRNGLLKEVTDEIAEELAAFNTSVAKHGMTYMTDGKDDAAKDHTENSVLVSPHGWQWVCSEDTSGQRRNAQQIAERIEGAVEDIDAQLLKRLTKIQSELDGMSPICQKSIVQVVTDTPRANANAWTTIEEDVEHLLANPCTLHGVSLHFKHCEKGDSEATPPLEPVDQIAQLNGKAKIIEQHFSNKDYPKKALKMETEKKERFGRCLRVRKFSVTRMGNMYKVWYRLQRLKSCLVTVINSDGYKHNVKEDGQSVEALDNREVRTLLEDSDFWNDLNALVEIMKPAYELLRLCDGYHPSAGKFYYYALKLQNHYEDMAKKYDWADQFCKLWTADWDYVGCAFHSAGFMLEPEYAKMPKPEHCSVDLLVVAQRMLKAAPPGLNLSVSNITLELAKLNGMQGTFAVPVVQDQIKSCAGYMWWDTYGAGCPTLRWLASRILPQTTSAAAAESAWSEFDFIFNRRRNRMGKERASLLVYAHCNTRLLRRFKQVTYEENWVPCSDSEDSDPQDDPMDDDEDLE